MSRSKRWMALAVACVAGGLATRAQAIVLDSTGDPNANTTTPTGTLANSGWQWEGNWGGFSGTVIAPQYFITAQHVGGIVGQQFSFGGRTYTTTGFTNISSDLRVWKVAETFSTFAPLYTTTLPNDEVGKTFVISGRGTPRGTPVVVDGVTKGWQWGTYDGVRRWGENVVTAATNLENLNDSLSFSFDHGVANEGFLTFGDSGGGAFVQSGGTWKLVGMAWAIDKEPWSYSQTNDPNTTADDPFNAALTDEGGLYDWSGNPAPSEGTKVNDTTQDIPMVGYLSRISPFVSSITSTTTGSPTWNVDASGNWGTASNWWRNTVPSGTTAEAILGSVNTVGRTVTLDTTRTVGTLTIDSPSGYTLVGTNALTIQSSTGTGLVRVYSGNSKIATPLVLASGATTQFNIQQATSTLTLTGVLTSTNSTVQKLGAGTLVVNNIRNATLDLEAGKVQVAANGGNAGVSHLSNLSIASGAALDLTNNDLIVDYSGASPFTSIQNWVFSGFSSSVDPNKTGIISSTGQTTNGAAILALFDNALVHATEWPPGSGITIPTNSVVGKYTYFGDTNLDGQVTADDYGALDANFGALNVPAGSAWFTGDTNLDGMVTADDYGALDANFGLGTGNPLSAAGVAAVPEPGLAWGAVACLALGMMKRSRRLRSE